MGGGGSYKIVIEKFDDFNGDGILTIDDINESLVEGTDNRVELLKGDGDFRSKECIELLKEADIVCTNPPFSLFREYVAQLMEYDKKFIIIGNKNAFSVKEIFPLIRDNRLWVGYCFPRNFLNFDGEVTEQVNGLCRWFTNLYIPKRNDRVTITEKYSVDKYPKYDNYNAIEVGKVSDIPCDYAGVMGVPITFIDNYNPEQFEILGITQSWDDSRIKTYPRQIQVDRYGNEKVVTKLNDGPSIEVDDIPDNKTYYCVDGKCYIKAYARILIRNISL